MPAVGLEVHDVHGIGPIPPRGPPAHEEPVVADGRPDLRAQQAVDVLARHARTIPGAREASADPLVVELVPAAARREDDPDHAGDDLPDRQADHEVAEEQLELIAPRSATKPSRSRTEGSETLPRRST